MAALPVPTARTIWRWAVLGVAPLVWFGAAKAGLLDFVEQRTVDWRFRVRGELPAPVKVIYVDIDSKALAEIGGWPWGRELFARVCRGLIERGGARAVGIDIVLSDTGQSQLADQQRLVAGNLEFANYLRGKTAAGGAPPPVVLAAAFGADTFRDINGRELRRSLPRVQDESRPLAALEPPELPQFEFGRPLAWTPPRVGLIDTLDGGTRWVPAYAPTNVQPYRHVSVELARLYHGVSVDGIEYGAAAIRMHDVAGATVLRIPLQRGQDLEVNWFTHWMPGPAPRTGWERFVRWLCPRLEEAAADPHFAFSSVLAYVERLDSPDDAERAAAAAFFHEYDFKDALVLIGPVDPLLQDLASTPFDDVPRPKVSVHGNAVKTVLSGRFLHRLPEWRGWPVWTLGLTVGLAVAFGAAVSTGGKRGGWRRRGAVAGLLLYVGAVFFVFGRHDLVLPLVAPLGAALSAGFIGIAWQLLEEQRQKSRIKGMFGAYVSPDLVDRMVESGESPQLGGHDAEITAYFSDIQGFSTFSETLGSGPLVELMNEYLTACTDLVQAEGGTLDKYIGDAVVAMFGAPIPMPDHAYRACVASLRVHRQLAELRTKWRGEPAKWPPLVAAMQSRIGLNTGVCMIGNMGSRTRFNYTMMGDNVNLAARMESGAKSWGVYAMCTDATRQSCERHGGDHVVFRPLARIVVKGRTQAVPIFELVGLREHVSAETHECLRLFGEGLARYYARDWAGAAALFERSAPLEPHQPSRDPGVVSNPSLVYREILRHYEAEPPPPDWDGVYVMKEK